MNGLILKIQEGDLFRFFDGEGRDEITVGSRKNCTICLKSPYVLPMQIRLVRKNGIWYAEDLSGEEAKSCVLLDGKKFKKPMLRFGGTLSIRQNAKKEKTDLVKITRMRQISRKKTSDFDLTAKTITSVGSGEDCDIRLNNPLVSPRHFFIVFDGENCFIEDAHSLGGTYVNNKKIKRQKLSDYDRISIPSAAYIFFRNKLLFSTAAGGIQIDAANISKIVQDKNSHGKISLVTNVTFRIEAGEFVAIVGGSGAGKSTLLDCINGMRPATEGKIYYDTNDYYENMNSFKGVIGYVPQRDIMHDDLTVSDALRYTAMLRMRANLPKEELTARVNAALEDVRLTGKEHLRISALSGGQKKRVSIAMELLSDPKVIFLDEPTSGLSPDLDMEMMDLLKELAKKGRTIVVITHAMENLDKCDRVAFLGKGGRICFFGAAKNAFSWFNRRSFSRIFAALSDEKVSESFAKKYRASSDYKKIYDLFCDEYGKNSALSPEKDEKEKQPVWEARPKDLPRIKRPLRAQKTALAGSLSTDGAAPFSAKTPPSEGKLEALSFAKTLPIEGKLADAFFGEEADRARAPGAEIGLTGEDTRSKQTGERGARPFGRATNKKHDGKGENL